MRLVILGISGRKCSTFEDLPLVAAASCVAHDHGLRVARVPPGAETLVTPLLYINTTRNPECFGSVLFSGP